MSNAFRITPYNSVILEFDGYSLEIVRSDGTGTAPKDDGTRPRAPKPSPVDAKSTGRLGRGPRGVEEKSVGRPPLDPGIIGFVHGGGGDVTSVPAHLSSWPSAVVDVSLDKLLTASPAQLRRFEQSARSRRAPGELTTFYLDVGLRVDQRERLDILRDLGSIVTDVEGNSIAGIRLIQIP
jgi:hypothetical protein